MYAAIVICQIYIARVIQKLWFFMNKVLKRNYYKLGFIYIWLWSRRWSRAKNSHKEKMRSCSILPQMEGFFHVLSEKSIKMPQTW